jgi:hypothetical protein
MATTPGRAHRSAAPTTSTATRGIILVACAVFIGVLLLWKGGGDQTVNAAGSDVLQTDNGGNGGGAAGATSSTVPATVVPPAELKVVTVNASGQSGVAKAKGQALQAAGYPNTTWLTATDTLPTSIVYFTADAKPEADAVATAIGIDPAAVQPLPNPPPATKEGPIPPDTKTVVMIGTDLAGK